MSLEAKIEELTRAVDMLRRAFEDKTTQGTAQPAPTVAATPEPSAPPAAAPATSESSTETPAVTRDSAKENAKKLNAKDAEKLKAILSGLGVKNFSAVPDDKLAEFDVKVREALA